MTSEEILGEPEKELNSVAGSGSPHRSEALEIREAALKSLEAAFVCGFFAGAVESSPNDPEAATKALAAWESSPKAYDILTVIQGPVAAPPHRMGPEVLSIKLQSWANNLFGRYGAPVYLVGSSLKGGGNDVDIRIVIPYDEYYARWPKGHGDPAWANEMGKQGRQGAKWANANIDLQVQNDVEAIEFKDHPRLRLDTVATLASGAPASDGREGRPERAARECWILAYPNKQFSRQVNDRPLPELTSDQIEAGFCWVRMVEASPEGGANGKV